MRILYIGLESGTCLDRANALRRLGHDVTHIDIRKWLLSTKWVDRLIWTIGGGWTTPWLSRCLTRSIECKQYDLCYVDNGELVTPRLIQRLREYAPKVVNYCIDDPLGGRDGARYKVYRRAVPYYDACIVVREQNVLEAKRLGARNIKRVYMSADEVSHSPQALTAEDRKKWGSDVLFVGTWFPERGPFLLELIRQGIPLSIRGSRWHKDPEWNALRPYWRGGAIQGSDYAKAIQCAKISLGLLSKGNRDLHTTRSLEIPSLGGLLCAERSSEHLSMYRENAEAMFWESAQECVSICRSLLGDAAKRDLIAAAGRRRAIENRHFNEPTLEAILSHVANA